MRIFILLLLSFFVVIPSYADCINPAGVEGKQIYNTTYKTMQFCDGTNWIAMRGGVAGDNLGNHTATQNLDLSAYGMMFGNSSIIKADQGGAIELGAGNGVGGTGTPYIDFHFNGLTEDYNARLINIGDSVLRLDGAKLDMGNNQVTNMAPPIISTDAATKAYVDGLTGANETDPKIGTLTEGKWCTVSGGEVVCTSDAPGGEASGTIGGGCRRRSTTSWGNATSCSATCGSSSVLGGCPAGYTAYAIDYESDVSCSINFSNPNTCGCGNTIPKYYRFPTFCIKD